MTQAIPVLKWRTALLGLVSTVMFALLGLPIAVLIGRALLVGGWQDLPTAGTLSTAIWLSLRTTAISVLVIVALGTPLAYVLSRWQFAGKRLVNMMVELPIVMPPAVAGLALLLTFGRRGVLGDALASIGVTVPFTSLAVIIAQIFVSAPFYIRAAQIGFSSVSDELEDAARVDGASDWLVFWRVTLPLSLRNLSSGLVLSWARAVGEFGATILFAGSIQGRTQTMPLLVYAVFERDINAAIWTGVILIATALFALMINQWLLKSADV
jgi:molybdate transport system permease protein